MGSPNKWMKRTWEAGRATIGIRVQWRAVEKGKTGSGYAHGWVSWIGILTFMFVDEVLKSSISGVKLGGISEGKLRCSCEKGQGCGNEGSCVARTVDEERGCVGEGETTSGVSL